MTEKVFLPHPSSPARRGSTSLLNPPILRREDLTGKPAVLYSQTSFNFVDFRLRSAEHSSELDALLSLARELRLFYARCAIVYAPRAPMRKNTCGCLLLWSFLPHNYYLDNDKKHPLFAERVITATSLYKRTLLRA